MKPTTRFGRKRPTTQLTEAQRERRFAEVSTGLHERVARAHPIHPDHPVKPERLSQADADKRAAGLARRLGIKGKGKGPSV